MVQLQFTQKQTASGSTIYVSRLDVSAPQGKMPVASMLYGILLSNQDVYVATVLWQADSSGNKKALFAYASLLKAGALGMLNSPMVAQSVGLSVFVVGTGTSAPTVSADLVRHDMSAGAVSVDVIASGDSKQYSQQYKKVSAVGSAVSISLNGNSASAPAVSWPATAPFKPSDLADDIDFSSVATSAQRYIGPAVESSLSVSGPAVVVALF